MGCHPGRYRSVGLLVGDHREIGCNPAHVVAAENILVCFRLTQDHTNERLKPVSLAWL